MATISGTIITSGVVLSTSGSFASPLTVASDGAVEVASGDAINGPNSQAWIVENHGTVTSSGGNGVYLQAGGTVSNLGTAALIQATAQGVLIAGGGSVINSGTIVSSFDAVNMNNGGYVGNAGGLIEGRYAGIYIRQGAGFVTNSGTVTGTTGNGIGVQFVGAASGGSTLVNSGAISGSGGTAVQFGGAGNRVVLYPGAAFTGTVSGGTGANNTLELASAASVGTVSGIGTQYVGFNHVTVDADARWTLTASNTIATGVTLTDLGTLTNAGTLIGSLTTYGSLVVDTGTMINAGSIGLMVTLSNGGYLKNNLGHTISYAPGAVFGTLASAIVVNNGTMLGPNGYGVNLYQGGSVRNLGASALIDGANGGVFIGSAAGTVTNTGTIEASANLSVAVFINGTGTVANNAGLISGFNGIYIFGTAGLVTNAGTIIGTSGYGVNLGSGGTLIDSGTISGGGTAISFGGTSANLLVLRNGYQLSGAVAGSTTATDTVELRGTAGNAVTVDYNGLGLSSFEKVRFGTAGYDTLKVGNTSGALPVTLSGFILTSDTLDLTGITGGTLANGGTVNGGDQLIVSNGTDTVTLQLDTGENYTGLVWQTSPDGSGGTNVTTTACYCRGTMILTEDGEVAIEDLAIGDRVVTVSGEAKPIKWIGHRAYDGRFVVGNREVLPIRVAAGALADCVPVRDLLVSPEHSLYFDGVLVAARQLLNGATITQETAVEELEYFHIELDAHDIIFADRAPAESFVDCDNRGKFHNAAEFAALYPEGDHPRWQFCAPLLQWDSEEPNAIRGALIERAEVLGHRLDLDPDLHLVVDGVVVRPDSVDGRVHCFTVPAGSTAASLASRSAVPAEINADARDLRRLGVPVERLVLCDADLRVEAAHGHAGLREGFHEDEPSHRWTDGRAALPETWLRSFPGAFTLEVHLVAAELPYRLPFPARAVA